MLWDKSPLNQECSLCFPQIRCGCSLSWSRTLLLNNQQLLIIPSIYGHVETGATTTKYTGRLIIVSNTIWRWKEDTQHAKFSVLHVSCLYGVRSQLFSLLTMAWILNSVYVYLYFCSLKGSTLISLTVARARRSKVGSIIL